MPSTLRLTLSLLGLLGLSIQPAHAQVTSDSTLNTAVTPLNSQDSLVSGGSARGGNLFHSFQDFSIAAGGSATFLSAPEIERILARVTGNNASLINGTVQANADLFLLNPNGLILGPDARLQVNGSFVGTTAHRAVFADGQEFAAVAEPTLLSVSFPVGLQLGNRTTGLGAASIAVQGGGHGLSSSSLNVAPFVLGDRDSRLAVPPGKTLALIGGDVVLDGASLMAPEGRLSISGVRFGNVALAISKAGWTVTPDLTQNGPLNGPPDLSGAVVAGNILLRQKSLVEASGIGNGAIDLWGDNITIGEASLVLLQAFGEAAQTGEINLTAASQLELSGVDFESNSRAGILSQAVGGGTGAAVKIVASDVVLRDGATAATHTYGQATAGALTVDAKGSIWMGATPSNGANTFAILGSLTYAEGDTGNVDLNTSQLRLRDGGTVSTASFASGTGGDLTVTADEIEIVGAPSFAPDVGSNLSTLAFNTGPAGDLRVSTRNLRIRDGGTLTSSAVPSISSLGVPRPGSGQGNGGDVTVEASESIVISGTNPFLGNASSVGTTTLGQGSAGDTTVTSSFLKIEGGGEISTSTSAPGDAGSLNINADRILVTGQSAAIGLPSTIAASALTKPLLAQQAFFLDPLPTGNTGSLNLNAGDIRVEQGGNIGVLHQGIGNAGQLQVTANNIAITTNGSLSAATALGEGGNIQLDLREALLLQSRGQISAEAGDRGNGGSVTISVPWLILLNNSQIQANAFAGNGGNVTIDGQGIFLSRDSSITASSELGVNGTVMLQTPAAKPSKVGVELPDRMLSTENQILASCQELETNRLSVRGRGGLPTTPVAVLQPATLWKDEGSTGRPTSTSIAAHAMEQQGQNLVEAIAFYTAENGMIHLVNEFQSSVRGAATCPKPS